jgi:hypothetical protein
MQSTDRAAFKTLLGDVMGFYRQDVSTFALSVWWQACENFELEQVRKAFTSHAMDPERGQFAPKPADVVRQLQGTFTDRSLIAWGKVLDAVRRVGAYQSVTFDDPAIHAAIVDLGGWPKVCRSEMEELAFIERRFCAMHKAYSLRPDIPYPSKLIGQHEADNQGAGYEAPKPYLIGDAKRAEAVLQNGSSGRTQITKAGDALRLESGVS